MTALCIAQDDLNLAAFIGADLFAHGGERQKQIIVLMVAFAIRLGGFEKKQL